MKKRLFGLLIVLAVMVTALCITVSAATVGSGTCGNNLIWTLDDEGTLTISGTGAMTDYASSNTVPWNYLCSGIKKVVINNGVTRIGLSAFYHCDSLVSVEISSSVTSIGASAFSGCSSLTSIDIPNSVKSIGGFAFSDCSSLGSVVLPNEITTIPTDAFLNCINLPTIIIPDSVTDIEGNAFHGCISLTSIKIPSNVTSIEGNAFSGCSNLSVVEIPNGVTSIGLQAFCGCISLTHIKIPSSVVNIEYGAFSNCTSLVSIEVDSDNQDYSVINGVLYNKNQTTLVCCPGGLSGEYIIPSSVTSIGTSAFRGCTGLSSIEIPNSVTNIESEAFSECSSLVSIDIPSSVNYIGGFAFNECSSLTSIEIPDGVLSLDETTFFRCTGLISIDIPNSIYRIRDWAFLDCSSLADIYYHGSAKEWSEILISEYNDPLLTATLHLMVIDSTVPATCTNEGEEKDICTICGKIKTKVIPALGHTVVTDAAVTPTCTESGKTEGSHCSVCDTVLVVQEDIPALGHSWDGGTVTTFPTCTQIGIMTYTCSLDNSHTYDHIPALGHVYGEPVWAWADTFSASAAFTCQHDSSHVETISAKITVNHELSCDIYTATVTFEDETYTDTKDVPTVSLIASKTGDVLATQITRPSGLHVNVIVACYDSYGKMTDIRLVVDAPNLVGVSLPEAQYYKVFLVQTGTFTPLCEALPITP